MPIPKPLFAGLLGLAILATTSLVATAPATEAEAGTSFYIYEYTYFSDASLTTQVGYARQGCVPGTNTSWGQVTAHQTSNIIGWCEVGGGGAYY